MPQALARVLAIAVFVVHLGWILWVIFGALLTRGRRGLTWFHIGSLGYGVFIESVPIGCPLTALEQALLARAGWPTYEGDFLTHYLQALIYPSVPYWSLIVGAIAVAGVNAVVYMRRWRRGTRSGES
jgi:hypothetical protein